MVASASRYLFPQQRAHWLRAPHEAIGELAETFAGGMCGEFVDALLHFRMHLVALAP